MASTAPMQHKKDLYRRMIDKSTKCLVIAGGLGALMALLLIVFYLFWVVFPLFTSAKLSLTQSISTDAASKVIGLGFVENGQYAYRFSENGNLTLYEVNQTKPPILDKTIVEKHSVSSFFSPPARQEYLALGLKNGKVEIQQLTFSKLKPRAVSLLPIAELFVSDSAIDSLNFALNNERLTLAAIANQKLFIIEQQGELIDKKEIALEANSKIALNQAADKLFVLSKNSLDIYQLGNKRLELLQQVNLSQMPQKARDMLLLPNDKLLITLENNQTTLWFETTENQQKTYKLQQRFASKNALLAAESRRSIFASLNENQLSLWHAPDNTKHSITLPDLARQTQQMQFSALGDNLALAGDNWLNIYHVDNLYPEINLKSLWQKIHYQGEAKAEYIWDSGSENSDKKFSLVPLLFGSLKITLLTLAIATPIALGSAIYTAYFMPMQLRKWVKPCVELMEALPTVILGFLASLWLAPWLEYHLLDVLLFIVLAPLCFFMMALGFAALPKHWQKTMSAAKYLVLLSLVILMLSKFCAMLSHWLILQYWQGDGQLFASQVFGLDVEQKNALVVGIAMGFAIIPTIFSISEDAIFSVPRHLSDASIALGATPWQSLTHVVLTTASPGIFSALMMGASRAIGETLIVLMASGNALVMDWNPFVGLRSLAANIAIEMPESVQASSHFRLLFLTALLLFCFTFLFNTLAELVRERLKVRYSAL